MFRILQIDSASERRLIVQGRLVSDCVEELRRAWLQAHLNLRHQTLVIDVADISVIAEEGERLLLELAADGAKFAGGAFYMNCLLHELGIRKSIATNSQPGIFEARQMMELS